MFSIVHVLLPFSEEPPAAAIRASLAPFERGGRGDLPDEWLTFHDDTEHLARLHRTAFVFSRAEGGGIRIEGGEFHPLDIAAIRAEMASRGLNRWSVRFADVEPDLAAFAQRFTRGLERHPITGGFGRWLNPLGAWDWWDLGGRFDGRIVGERHRAGRAASVVSSGPNPGRSVLRGVETALAASLAIPAPTEVVVEADNNIELVSRLLDDTRAGRDHAFPGAILLPPGSTEDRTRWVRSWPEVGPASALIGLGLSQAAEWQEVVIAAYERSPDHWAAGVAFHL